MMGADKVSAYKWRWVLTAVGKELPQTGRTAESWSECVGVKACDDTSLLSFYALQPFSASK